MASLLITGFGPFGSVSQNPSGLLALSHSAHHILEVSFAAVDRFIASRPWEAFDQLLLMGVADAEPRFRLERAARNYVGAVPDVRGVCLGPGQIDPSAPSALYSTLWTGPLLEAEGEFWRASDDAGSYLCNYLFFRALQYSSGCRVGFLHVPLLEAVPLETQLAWLDRLAQSLTIAEHS